MQKQSYFVIAAVVASELHQAMLVAKDISLTASNARALALRAGQGAAGFRAITEFIDELATKTVNSSQKINSQAIAISKLASETARTEDTLNSFQRAHQSAASARFLASIDKAYKKVEVEYACLLKSFDKQVRILISELEELAKELRTAAVLSTMSQVEASQSGKQFEKPLAVIAANVASAADNIRRHVHNSQRLFQDISYI